MQYIVYVNVLNISNCAQICQDDWMVKIRLCEFFLGMERLKEIGEIGNW